LADEGGNCLVAGLFGQGSISFEGVELSTMARFEGFVVKYSQAGDVRWALSTVGDDPAGNGIALRISSVAMNDYANFFARSAQGGLFVSGIFTGTVEFGDTKLFGPDNLNGGNDVFLAHMTDPDTVVPTLRVARAGKSLSLSWPSAASGFVLESTGSLAPPANWTPETAAPVSDAEQNTVTLPLSDGAKFYRLHKP
jgi:hypothetical protein